MNDLTVPTGQQSIDSPSQPGPKSSKLAGDDEALVSAVIEELRIDRIKQAALRKSNNGWPQRISNFFQHPAVMLVLGFVLTGMIGGVLTHLWQQREIDRQQQAQNQEWERQQRRLLEIHSIDLKYGIIDELTKAVGERNAAATVIIMPLLKNINNQQLAKEEQEPVKNWQAAVHTWRVNSQVLRLKVATHIKNSQAESIFDNIIKEETSIASKLEFLQTHLTEYNRVDEDKDARKYVQDLLDQIGTTAQQLKSLISMITEETQNDVRGNT